MSGNNSVKHQQSVLSLIYTSLADRAMGTERGRSHLGRSSEYGQMPRGSICTHPLLQASFPTAGKTVSTQKSFHNRLNP